MQARRIFAVRVCAGVLVVSSRVATFWLASGLAKVYIYILALLRPICIYRQSSDFEFGASERGVLFLCFPLFLFNFLDLFAHNCVVARAPDEVVRALIVLEITLEPLGCSGRLVHHFEFEG